MEDLTSVPLSTVLDADSGPSAAGGGQMPLRDPERPTTPRDDLAAVFAEDDKKRAEDAKAPPKEAVEPKAEKAEPAAVEKAPKVGPEAEQPKEKVEAKAAETEEEATQREEKEKSDKRHVEAPAKFLPRARELWRNTPREVQTEVDRITREHGEEIQHYKMATERYEGFRQFDELAKNNGRDLRDSLVKMNHIENLIQRNPIAGLHAILAEIGPRKADGSAVSLFELASHVVNQGQQAFQTTMYQEQQRAQAERPNQEMEQMKAALAKQEEQLINVTTIEPFKRDHPRYDELQDHIALFLQSGMVPKSLSPSEKLAVAYDMAERISPPSNDQRRDTDRGLESARRADPDFSGSKSIKSEPGAVSDQDTDEYAEDKESIRDSILKASRSLRRA
jgi:uncharacterized protein YfkK (UPF0435 family)